MRAFKIMSAVCLAMGVGASPVVEQFLAGGNVPTANWMDRPQGQRTLPRMAESAPLDNAKRKEILYGPYTIKNPDMFNKMEWAPERPCSDCYITSMEATLKFADGREATTAEHGAWLHHIVLMNGLSPIWAAGNERPTLRLNSEIHKFGIDLSDNVFSRFMINVDLMSEAPKALKVKLSITYEYILKSQPEAANYRASVLMWNDVGQGPPPAKGGVFSFSSYHMPAPVSGTLLYAMGHMHDGGANTTLYIQKQDQDKKTEVKCASIMGYNTRPGYGGAMNEASANATIAPPAGERSHGHGGQVEHISDPGVCNDFGHVTKGDLVWIEAWYDADKHPLQSHNEKLENLMGIMRLFIGPDENK